jgi:UDP-glucuronate 4-epimerase
MNILITGIAGFIGSNLGERLISDGHKIVGLDNFDPFYPKMIKERNLLNLNLNKNFTFCEADIRIKPLIDEIFVNHKIDVVIHLAAKAGVRPSIENVSEYYDVNINGTVNILKSMHENNVTKLIFASSSSVYGNNIKVPFSEDDIVDFPISPYAATKKSGELLCHVFSHLYGFDITCLRFFTVFGPRQRPDLAIYKFTHLIDKNLPLPIFGDGSTSRDYTYIDDIIEGVCCAITHLDGYNIYNLGESNVIKLFELIEIIEKALGKKALIDKRPLQPGDVMTTYADISKARKELGYNPIFNMKTGIEKFIQWYKENI